MRDGSLVPCFGDSSVKCRSGDPDKENKQKGGEQGDPKRASNMFTVVCVNFAYFSPPQFVVSLQFYVCHCALCCSR